MRPRALIHRREHVKQSLALMGIYISIVIALQVGGFFVSRVVEYFNPALSLMTFLVLFMGMFAAAWPVAVRVSDRFIPETDHEREQRLARV
jgi:hypothetical protein